MNVFTSPSEYLNIQNRRVEQRKETDTGRAMAPDCLIRAGLDSVQRNMGGIKADENETKWLMKNLKANIKREMRQSITR